jgi:hypothetical protein
LAACDLYGFAKAILRFSSRGRIATQDRLPLESRTT